MGRVVKRFCGGLLIFLGEGRRRGRLDIPGEPSEVILVIGEDVTDGGIVWSVRGGKFFGVANLIEVNGFFEKAVGDYGAESCGGLVYGSGRPEAELKPTELTNSVEVFGTASVSEFSAVLGTFVVVACAEFVLDYLLAFDFEFAAVEGVGDIEGVLNLGGGSFIHGVFFSFSFFLSFPFRTAGRGRPRRGGPLHTHGLSPGGGHRPRRG